MLQPRKLSSYRFNLEAPRHLPLTVRSAGTYTLVPGFQMEAPMQKWFCEIFWSEEGAGEFTLGKQKYQVEGCEIFYLLPGEVHDIRPISERWIYHWLTLDHELGPRLLEGFGLVERPMEARECPVALFQKLQTAVEKATTAGDVEAAHLAHEILLAVSQGGVNLSRARRSLGDQSKALIDERFTDPQFNVTEMAKMMNVHRATLFRTFLSAHGMTPSQYLQNRRLHYAIELLKQGDLAIKEVAARVGMADVNYLARQVRKIAGVSPRVFRDRYRSAKIGDYDGRV
jgi:AraC-like DNA-binding protein